MGYSEPLEFTPVIFNASSSNYMLMIYYYYQHLLERDYQEPAIKPVKLELMSIMPI